MDQDVERRIRDRAYRIWEEEGCPSGRDVDHWLRAAQEVAAEEGKEVTSGEPVTKIAEPEETTAAEEEKPKRGRGSRAAKSTDDAKPEGSKEGTKGRAKTAGKSAAAETKQEAAPKTRRSSKAG